MGKSRNQGGTVKSILQRDKKCWICRRLVAAAEASRDHVNPRSAGGYNKAANYRLAHRVCNQARGSLPAEDVDRLVSQMEDSSIEAIQAALRDAWRDWLKDHKSRTR